MATFRCPVVTATAPRAIRLPLLLALLIASTPAARADGNPLTYHGLTLGAPVPDTVTPRSSQLFADQHNADRIPEDLLHICEHQLLGLGTGSLVAYTASGCDGPVVSISAREALQPFFNPDNQSPPVTTQLDGLTFKETTLAQARALFCSEGLIASTHYGQTEPDNIGAYALAYEIEGAGAVATFWFQVSRNGRWALSPPLSGSEPAADPALRDTAQLIAIDLTRADHFAALITAQTTGETRPSAGYVPLNDIFTNPAYPPAACSVS